MFEVSAYSHFDAAHFLREYLGKCANIHGHRWKVEISLRGAILNEQGILIDFMDVKAMLKQVLDEFDHKLINDVQPFDKLNPTAENIAKYIFDVMASRLRLGELTGTDISIVRVSVWESEAACATYSDQ